MHPLANFALIQHDHCGAKELIPKAFNRQKRAVRLNALEGDGANDNANKTNSN